MFKRQLIAAPACSVSERHIACDINVHQRRVTAIGNAFPSMVLKRLPRIHFSGRPELIHIEDIIPIVAICPKKNLIPQRFSHAP
jgi:hypothetical protein